MKKGFTIILIFCCLYSFGQSAEVEKIIQAGNDYYKQQQYDMAASEYQKALDNDPSNITAKFNLANTLYKKEKQNEAIKKLSEIAGNTKETGLKAKAYYNKGAILSQQKKLEESIEPYKNALRQNPDDKEARENLQKALLELKKKNPPKKQDNKKQPQPKKKPEPKMSPKEAEQRLKLLEQKEKEVQQRLQKEKSKTGGGQPKDW